MSRAFVGNEWSPCQHPERPFDADTVWHLQCDGCLVLADAAMRRDPQDRKRAVIRAFMEPDSLLSWR